MINRFIPILCLSIALLSGTGSAFSKDSTQSLQGLADRKLMTRDSSLLVPVAQTLERHRRKKILLIDVRPRHVFEQYSIPGSISLPLHTLKTKGFIREKKIVLVHQGFQYREMENECTKLRAKGYDVLILEGGINRWYRSGGAVQGNSLALKNINRIDSKTFFMEKDYATLLVFTINTDPIDIDLDLIPHSVELPKQNIETTLLRGIKKSNSRFPVILIASQDGFIAVKIEKTLNKSGIPNIFFLIGGLNAYHLFLEQQAILNNSSGNTITSGKGCRPCQNKY